MYYYEVSITGRHTGRQYYTYHHNEAIAAGTIVQCRFGKLLCFAIIRRVVKKPTFTTKEVVTILPFVLPRNSLLLLQWMEQFYPYDFGDIGSLFIPPNTLTKPRKQTISTHSYETSPFPTPTQDQKKALASIRSNNHIILHGNTASGKTRVFLDYANEVLRNGKSVLLLTPEIGLTPQLQSTIEKHCPYPFYINHSQKTAAQRRIIWEAAHTNKSPTLFVGPRSNLFLPYQSLGLIVIDEAHDGSYNNFQSPKYNGLYVAAKIAHLHTAHFIQSSATPNVSDYYIATQKNIPVVTMTTVAAGSLASKGHVVDMTQPKNHTQHALISDPLLKAISTALQHKEQSLLFINRRGSARVVQCNQCGHIQECDNCGIPYTFHHDTHELRCHVCTKHISAPSQCPMCGSTDIAYFTPGTKGIEQDIVKLFPTAKIARFDLDVSAQNAIHRQLEHVKNANVDIIIGTQLITKGFDLPKLSVVGILNADSGFALPDYRAEEIVFQQLYQVSGRVGRGHTLSNFFIQTKQPTHPVIEAALRRDWHEFYAYELHKRSQFMYPPFTYLALLSITKAKQSTAQKHALSLASTLRLQKNFTVLGPTPSFYETAQGGYTWQIVIKCKERSALVHGLAGIPSDWAIDMDPTSVL